MQLFFDLCVFCIFVLWLLIGLPILIVQQKRNNRRLAASGIAQIDNMARRQFEQYLSVLFQRLGLSSSGD